MVKVALFRYHFWLVLCLLFFTGTTRISIMGSGYLLGFGYFMLHGSRLLLKPVKFILRPWDRLIAYSVLVMALKTLMSVGKSPAPPEPDTLNVVPTKTKTA